MSESKALAIISPRSIDECMVLATELSKATTISAELRDKPANVLAAMMAGQELGFAPMASLRSVHIIKGVPKLTADAMVAAVLASGKALYFEPSNITNTSVTYVTKRVGSTREQTCTWTAEDAKRAGLTSDNHRLYPRQMLGSRAKSELARMVYPDVLAGVYTDDEPSERPVVDIDDAEFTVAAAVERAETQAVELPTEALTLIDRAQSVEQLKGEISAQVTDMKLTGSAKSDAEAAYKAKLKSLRAVETKPAESAA
jgi:hypothetical protein